MTQRSEKAKSYKSELGHEGGFVIFFGSEPTAWVKDLQGRCTWVPGCVAVDEHGAEWVATGGDDYDGAKKWEKS